MPRALCCLVVAIGVAGMAPAGDPIYTDNVVIVLDGSGSMKEQMPGTRESKMAAAKQALHEVLATLPETTHVGVLAFSSHARQPWLYDLGSQDAVRLRDAIDGLRPDGKTPLGRFLKLGADRLLEQRRKQFGYGSYRLLVVTDGEASDAKLVERYTPSVIARGITLDVIGVDMASRHTLATKAHSYRTADDADSLRQAIAEVFAEVSTTDSDDATGDDAFAVIAGLPPEIATAAVQALAISGNEPIGEADSAAPQRSSAPAQPRASSPQPQAPSKSIFMRTCCSGVFMLAILVIVAVVLLRKAKG